MVVSVFLVRISISFHSQKFLARLAQIMLSKLLEVNTVYSKCYKNETSIYSSSFIYSVELAHVSTLIYRKEG
jgi:hypothetical protein